MEIETIQEKRRADIKRVLDSLHSDLAAFVKRMIGAAPALGASMGNIKEMIDGIAEHHPLDDNLDSYTYLKLFTRVPGGERALRSKIDPLAFCFAHEMIVFRNKWAHDRELSEEHVERAKDTAEWLRDYLSGCSVFDAEGANAAALAGHEPFPVAPQRRDATPHQHEPMPHSRAPDTFVPGDVFNGVVVGITPHGYMLNLNKSKYYLMHKKNLGRTHLASRPLYRNKEEIEVRVLAVDAVGRPDLAPVFPKDPDDGHESPGRLMDRGEGEAQPSPWHGHSGDDALPAERAAEGVVVTRRPRRRVAPPAEDWQEPPAEGWEPRVGEVASGKVRGIFSHGASVSLPDRWNGYVHISNIIDGFVDDVADHVSVDEEIEAVILEIEPDKRRLKLGIKQLRGK